MISLLNLTLQMPPFARKHFVFRITAAAVDFIISFLGSRARP